MTWMAPTYHSEVMALLPAEKTRFEVVRPRDGRRFDIAAVDWRLKELDLFDRDYAEWLATVKRTVTLAAGVIIPPDESFVMRKQLLATPPWNNNGVFWCDFCRVWRPAFVLTDVEGFPADLTDGRKWACDGCRTRWFRQGKPADGQTISKRIWAQLMVDVHGAPAEFFDRVAAMEDADAVRFSL